MGASDLPVTVLDRIVLPDAKPGETQDEHEEPGDPLLLCDYLLLPEERLDRSALDAFISCEAGAENHRYARFPIRVLYCHNLRRYLSINEGCERNCCVAPPGLEKER